MHTVMRYHTTGTGHSAIIDALVTRLKDALKEVEHETFMKLAPNLLLWILFVGGAGAFDSTVGHYYMRELSQIKKDLKLGTCTEVWAILINFPWRDSHCEKHFKIVWDEVCQMDG
jgi:hypothetical protein